MCKAIEYANNLFTATNEIIAEWKSLSMQLSIVDKKVSDVEHFIELRMNLNASQGYKAYRMLKEVLEERRLIKNRQEELRPLYEFVNKTALNDNSKRNSLHKTITTKYNQNTKSEESKKYNVRVLTEVFGDVIQKEVV